jgi:adenylate kinase
VRVALTGTPGTGKTTASEALEPEIDLDVVHLNEVIREADLATGTDPERDSLVADLDAVEAWLGDRDDVLIESHLSHQLPVDRVVVLRCHPEELERRLRDRGESAAKATENAESEALDVILAEAVEVHGFDAVYEIDATERSPDAVAEAVERAITGERDPSAGDVSYIEYL